ncbi:uncharacterized protein [Palaemon carinicauda]|uniref:uncharacterized protein isoform X1 n=1 Tax=Palaemon carinicauda TaxID=392227 RepID=UPI0035B674B8
MGGRHCRYWYIFLVCLFLILNNSVAMSPEVERGESNGDDVEKLMQAYFDIDEKNEKTGRSTNQRFEDLLNKLRGNLIAGDRTPADISPAINSNKSKSSENAIVTERGVEQMSTSSDGSSLHKVKVSQPDSIPDAENDYTENEESELMPSTTTTSTTSLPPAPPSPSKRPKNPVNKFARGTEAPMDHQPPSTKATADIISPEELKSVFINSGRGSSIMIPGCNLVHFHVKSRCSGNLLELTLLSRSPLRGQVRLLEGDGEVFMDGTNLVAYGVLGPLSPSGNMWKLTKDVPKDDLQRECFICDNMSVRVVIRADEATCGMVVTCQQKGASRIISVEDTLVDVDQEVNKPVPRPHVTTQSPVPPASKSGSNSPQGGEPPIQDPGNTAKTTMTLVYSPDNINIEEMAGMPVTGRVSIGTRMNLILSVFSKDIALDLHVVRCQAKSDDGRGVFIVKDGCSISSVIGEFRETLNIVQESSFGTHTVRKVSQYAEVRAFNFRRSPQNITLICTIKMCGGECTERPTCVDSEINLSRSTRPPVPIFTQEVTLGKVFHVGGFPLDPSPDIANLMLDTDPNKGGPIPGRCPDGCIAFRTVIIMLCFITGVYLVITLVAIYYVRRSSTKDMKSYRMDDFESPPRSYYPEYSSPRRRTPQTSPEQTSFTISSEEKSSPSYGKKVKE